MRSAIALLLTVLATSPGLAANAGRIELPARELMDLREGTIEA